MWSAPRADQRRPRQRARGAEHALACGLLLHAPASSWLQVLPEPRSTCAFTYEHLPCLIWLCGTQPSHQGSQRLLAILDTAQKAAAPANASVAGRGGDSRAGRTSRWPHQRHGWRRRAAMECCRAAAEDRRARAAHQRATVSVPAMPNAVPSPGWGASLDDVSSLQLVLSGGGDQRCISCRARRACSCHFC